LVNFLKIIYLATILWDWLVVAGLSMLPRGDIS